MASISLCIAAMLLLGIVGMARSWLGRAHEVVHGGMALVCGAAALTVLVRLAGDGTDAETLALPVGLPWLRANLRLDALSAVFLLAVNLVGCLSAVFGWSYARHEAEPGRVLPFFPLFIAGMNLVLVADDAFVFLMAWEFMSLSSWLLVLASHREEETRRAAYVYLVMASFGTACLLLAFGILAGQAGGYGFEAIRAHPLGAVPASFAALLVLLGAGSKAGLVPLHVWLPLAHPAAPSHVSALMSGVMTKVAIYGLIRVLFDLVGEPLWWWGAVLAVLGAITAVVGVLYALMQDDVKKLLAYSTVENIGVIVIGLGLALVFKASGVPALAALAMTAAMLHVLNHGLFKSILFFGAGAVLTATGERDLDRLGGLIHRMPATALFCLVGAAAISALPPLNGFVAEWMLFQAVLNGPLLEQWELKIGFAVIALSWFLAVVIRLSLSRSREYLADAGAVELTKNPDAMISALLKIAGRADIEGVPSGVMDMCFENDPDDFADLFSTHPSVTKRVQALIQTAGGRMPAMPPQPPRVAERQDLPTMVAESAAGVDPAARGPWARPTGGGSASP